MTIPFLNSKPLFVTLATALGMLIALDCKPADGQSSPGMSPQPGASSSQRADQSTEQSKLVDGLLDLIESPSTSKQEVQPTPSSESTLVEASKLPAEIQTLSLVRQQMNKVASLLQEGKSDRETVDLQTNIVSQLDQLIAQQQQKSSQRSSKQRTQQTSQQSSRKSEQKNASQGSQNSTSEGTSGSEASEKGNLPGNQGATTDILLQRNDPTALQQNVWGHLPERVRSQMQSRMVEEFLPAYREQIEAYYRALLEEGNKK